MKHTEHKYQESDFEGAYFVKECLQMFDDGVKKIEEEYAITSKSA